MGMIGKLLILAIIVAAGMWAYENVKVDTVTVCVGNNQTQLDVTCVDSMDCSRYLTSLYGTYPDTPMYNFLLSQVTTCNVGKCQMNSFRFQDVCMNGETPIVYKVTVKELVSVK